MKDLTEKHIKLADYIYGDLSVGEMEDLEKDMAGEPGMAELHQMNKKVTDYLKAKISLEEFRSDPFLDEAERLAELACEPVPSIDDKDSGKSPVRRNRPWRAIWMTAAAAAVVVLALVFASIPGSNPDRLYKAYYESFPASDYSQRSEPGSVNQALADGIDLYLKGNYQQSIRVFEQLEENPGILPETVFFRGLNYMGLEQYKTAAQILASYAGFHAPFRPEALWYLSLCHLKTGHYQESADALKQLEVYQGKYQKDAFLLGKKLRRIK